MTKINKSRIILAVMSVAVGLYPVVYLFLDREFGLLATKSQELLDNMVWNVGFYIHIFLGGIALLIGWMQFYNTIRLRYPGLHKTVGMIYILSVSMSAISGIYISAFATGGIISSVGFILLGIIWLLSTLLAFWHIKKKQIISHQKMMIYSYSACFAAVTLRIWLPILMVITGDFEKAYTMVAWLCWVPNMIVANYFTRKMGLSVSKQ